MLSVILPYYTLMQKFLVKITDIIFYTDFYVNYTIYVRWYLHAEQDCVNIKIGIKNIQGPTVNSSIKMSEV